MAQTPNYGFPYQTLTDPPDGPNLGEDGFLAVDAVIRSIDSRLATVEAAIIAAPRANGVSALSTTAGTDTTTSATYVNMAGTGSQTSFTITKRFGAAVSRLRVSMQQIMYQSGGSFPFVQLGVLIGSTDYDIVGAIFSAAGTNTTLAGSVYVPGLAAGSYTLQARWKRVSGTGTLTRDSGGWLAFDAEEVSV